MPLVSWFANDKYTSAVSSASVGLATIWIGVWWSQKYNSYYCLEGEGAEKETGYCLEGEGAEKETCYCLEGEGAEKETVYCLEGEGAEKETAMVTV